jgi:hypothetical protein
MKKIKIWYWIITILFCGLMLFWTIPQITKDPEWVKIITGLGYPVYFVQFIGIAKLLGIIAVLIPGLRSIKEWAYAGLFFDLAGVVFSALNFGFQPPLLTMALPIGLLFASYFLWHKLVRNEPLTRSYS